MGHSGRRVSADEAGRQLTTGKSKQLMECKTHERKSINDNTAGAKEMLANHQATFLNAKMMSSSHSDVR